MAPRSPHTTDEVLEYLLGRKPGCTVEAQGATYILPEGMDPERLPLGTISGYEFVEDPDHCYLLTPRPRDGVRTNWTARTSDEHNLTLNNPRIHWSDLGDLRHHIQLIAEHIAIDKTTGALRYRDHCVNTTKQDARRRIAGLIHTILGLEKQLDKEYRDLALLFGILGESITLESDHSRFLKARELQGRTGKRESLQKFIMRINNDYRAAGNPPPPYPIRQFGRKPAALRVVHVAYHYLCGRTRDFPGKWSTCRTKLLDDVTGKDLAMIVALDRNNGTDIFGKGAQYLDNTASGRRDSRRYWKALIRSYGEPKNTSLS